MSVQQTPSAARVTEPRVTPWRVVQAEFVKLRTLRSNWILVLAVPALVLVLGVILALVSGSPSQGSSVSVDDLGSTPAARVTASAVSGTQLAMVLAALLGVLAVTAEYTNGLIRTTLSVVPRRWYLPVAKATVLTFVLFAVTSLGVLVTFPLAAALGPPEDAEASLTSEGVLRALVAAGVFLACVGVLGAALGWALRSTAGAVTTLLGVLLVIPPLVGILPERLGEQITPYLPSILGQTAMTLTPEAGPVSPGGALALLIVYGVVATAAACALLQRRDS